jgi:hypothetical protein
VLCQLSYTPERISDLGSECGFENPKPEISQSEFQRGWLRGRDLNPRPLGYEPNELPDCSTPRQSQTQLPKDQIRNPKSEIRNPKLMVGLGRVELPTSRLSGVRSNQLSYRPRDSSANTLTALLNAIFAAKKSHTSLECGPFQRWTRPRAV